MSDATTTDGASSADGSADHSADPTLAALVPRRSPARNVLLAAAAVMVLVLAWLSPNALRPSLVEDGVSTWSALRRSQLVLATTEVTVEGWGDVTVRSVDDAPGAELVGGWLFPIRYGVTSSAGKEQPTGVGTVRAYFPEEDIDSAGLPQRLSPGIRARLVLLWKITDCSRLGEVFQLRATLESTLRTTVVAHLNEWSGPAAHTPDLVESGICPVGSVPGGF